MVERLVSGVEGADRGDCGGPELRSTLLLVHNSGGVNARDRICSAEETYTYLLIVLESMLRMHLGSGRLQH